MRAAVLADAPELLALLPDLSSSLAAVRQRTAPLLAELRATPDLATREGMSYLDAKHMLLMLYSIHILFYILLKLEGQPVRDHPVMQRLLAAKTYLEKLKGLDKRLQHQVEKLLRAAKVAAAGGGAGEGAADEAAGGLRANPAALVSKLDEDMDGGDVYRPPKMTAVTMDGEEGGGREARQAERAERAELRRARQSAFVRDLEAEVTGAPEEEAAVGAVGGARDASNVELLKQQQRLEARAAAEEDLMVRPAQPRTAFEQLHHCVHEGQRPLLCRMVDTPAVQTLLQLKCSCTGQCSWAGLAVECLPLRYISAAQQRCFYVISLHQRSTLAGAAWRLAATDHGLVGGRGGRVRWPAAGGCV